MVRLVGILIFLSPVAYAAEVCKNELNQLSVSACEAELKLNKCDQVKSQIKDQEALKHFKDCSVATSASEYTSAAVNCSASAMLFGVYVVPRIFPAAVTVISRMPVVLSPVAIGTVGVIATSAAYAIAAISTPFLFKEGIEADKACFDNIEMKTNYMKFAKRKADYLQQKIGAHLSEDEKRRIIFPEEYLKEDFIKNLSCTRMREILNQQEKKQTPIVGKLLANKKIGTDPRNELPISDEDKKLVNEIQEVIPCLTTAKKVEVACGISNFIVSGGQLTKAIAGFTKVPTSTIVAQKLAGSRAVVTSSAPATTAAAATVANNGTPATAATTATVVSSTGSNTSAIVSKYPNLAHAEQKIDLAFDTSAHVAEYRGTIQANTLKHYHTVYKTPAKHQAAINEISARMYDQKELRAYTKKLQREAAEWIDKNGTTAEKALLKAEGQISEQSVVEVLKTRAQARGETVGVIKTDEDGAFLRQIVSGPFIDDFHKKTFGGHGKLAHFIQMDFAAPTIEKHFGKGGRGEFYQYITKNKYWYELFDFDGPGVHSPENLTELISNALRLGY